MTKDEQQIQVCLVWLEQHKNLVEEQKYIDQLWDRMDALKSQGHSAILTNTERVGLINFMLKWKIKI